MKKKPNIKYTSILNNNYNITYSYLYNYKLINNPTLQFQKNKQ